MKRPFAALAGLLVLSASTAAFAWDAGESRDNVGGKGEWRGNTHLFIVEKAIDLLKHSSDPFALGAARFLDSCTKEWRQGLFDADDRSEFVDSDNHGSHFYDPTPTDHCHTYALLFSSCVSGSLDARQNAKNQIQHFATGKSAVSAKTYGHHNKSRCYALGMETVLWTPSSSASAVCSFFARPEIQYRLHKLKGSGLIPSLSGSPI